MAHSEVQAATSMPVRTAQPVRADRAERYLRRITAWVLLVFLLQGELGAIWDREWHFFVGRDWFWTPPHTLIYSCVSVAGLIALAVVLTDTIRYRRGAPGVDDSSTIPIFGLFHAPLGYVIAGFGALVALAAAPLDNYWHNLYGIDIALWAPFHMMGVLGGAIGITGMAYVFASESAIQRDSGYPYRRFLSFSWLEWGALFVIAAMVNFTFTGFEQFPVATFGLLRIPSYILPLALVGPIALIGAVRFTNRPGAATLLIFLLLIHTVLEELFVPWAIRTAVSVQGLAYRVPQIPYFNVTDALLPLIFLVPALIVDGVALWQVRHGQTLNGVVGKSWLLGIIITIPEMVVASCMVMGSWNIAQVFLEQSDVIIPQGLKLETALIAIPFILAFGVVGALAGVYFGDIWRWNKS